MLTTREFTVGDTLVPLKAKLFRPGGAPVVLDATDVVTFRMVSTAGVAKISNGEVTVLDRGSLATKTPAEVQYDWDVWDVDTPGEYVAWFVRTSWDNKPEHFPVQDPDNPEFIVIFRADS